MIGQKPRQVTLLHVHWLYFTTGSEYCMPIRYNSRQGQNAAFPFVIIHDSAIYWLPIRYNSRHGQNTAYPLVLLLLLRVLLAGPAAAAVTAKAGAGGAGVSISRQ